MAGEGDLDLATVTISQDKKISVDFDAVTNVAEGDRVKCELFNGQTVYIKVTKVAAGDVAEYTIWIV